jgi:hypothetical protein
MYHSCVRLTVLQSIQSEQDHVPQNSRHLKYMLEDWLQRITQLESSD